MKDPNERDVSLLIYILILALGDTRHGAGAERANKCKYKYEIIMKNKAEKKLSK